MFPILRSPLLLILYIDWDGAVHLLHLLFSVSFGTYSFARRMFALNIDLLESVPSPGALVSSQGLFGIVRHEILAAGRPGESPMGVNPTQTAGNVMQSRKTRSQFYIKTSPDVGSPPHLQNFPRCS